MSEVSYVPGPHVALVGEDCALLLLSGVGPDRVRTLWPLVRDGADVDLLLEALAVGGLRTMGDFALVRRSTVVLRGGASAVLSASEQRLDGGSVRTWAEHVVPDGELVWLCADGRKDDAERLPLVAGVVRAAGVGFESSAPAPSPLERVPEPVTPAAPQPAPEQPLTATVPPDWTLAPVPEPEPDPAVEGLVDDVPISTAVDDTGYDHLFGDTVHRSIEDAAVRPASEEPGLPAADDVDTDHDGSTVLRSALRGRRTAPAPAAGGATVLAVRCLQGHPNPPHSTRCRSCPAAVEDQDPLPVPRPPLGVLRVSDGSQAPLDRNVLIGRAPASNRFSGERPPHLLRVASPEQDISRTHVEFRVEDWNVLVVDLSANGTRLVRPGAEPQMLHKGEPVLVLPGSLLDLGDGVTVVYEATSA